MSRIGDQDYPLYAQLLSLITGLYKQQEAQAFIRLPLKSTPGYYDTIRDPISITNIKRKLVIEQDYKNVGEMKYDFNLMWQNCRQYNQEESMIVECADQLERKVNKILNKFDDKEEIQYPPMRAATKRQSKGSRLTKQNLNRLYPKSMRASKRPMSSRASSARKSVAQENMKKKQKKKITSEKQFVQASLKFIAIFAKLNEDDQDTIIKKDFKVDEHGSAVFSWKLIEKLEEKYEYGLF